MKDRIIKAAPDYLPINAFEFLGHFANLFTSKTYEKKIEYENYTIILGYSCRALFETCLEFFKKDDLVIATTPIQHTSFRNIIEKFVKPDNNHIIELNDNYNGIGKIPKLDKCDIVVITHLFGQDMDLSVLADFKKKHDCIIIEDRVQGGSLDIKFSNEVVDVSIYSMGMDKRPVALGGGFVHIDNKHDELIKDVLSMTVSLPKEKTRKRFNDLLKKIPTFLFYNSRFFLSMFVEILRAVSFFNRKISLLKFANSYRAKNPGFNRETYMKKPSEGLLKSMYKKLDKFEKMEKLFKTKHSFFMNSLAPEIGSHYFPWYKGTGSLSAYHTILIEENLVDQFLEFLTDKMISCIANPTYKVFNHSYEGNEKDIKFNNGIVYIPSTANMKKKEMSYLAYVLKTFYNSTR